MPSLIDRLNNLGLKSGSEVKAPQRIKKATLSETLGAETLQNEFGQVVIVKNSYLYGYMHGVVNFANACSNEMIHRAGHVIGQPNNLKNLLFLDTETTGLSGGTGTLAFLIGVARFDDEGLKLTQFIIEDPSEEAAMLLEIANFTQDVEAVVTFNGKSFDMPLLRSRYILNRLPIHFTNWGHLDLLHLSRRIWKQRLPSRSLKDLEQEILLIPRSENEVPGWMIPEIYFDYLRSGDASQLSNVIYHNSMDIISLAALYILISDLLSENLVSGNIHDLDKYAIGLVYENIGGTEQAKTIYDHCLMSKSLSSIKLREIEWRLSLIYKKELNWQKATPLWEGSGNAGDYYSCLELAKYFEHIEKNPQLALVWTKKAETLIDILEVSKFRKKALSNELVVRKNRLEKRSSYV